MDEETQREVDSARPYAFGPVLDDVIYYTIWATLIVLVLIFVT